MTGEQINKSNSLLIDELKIPPESNLQCLTRRKKHMIHGNGLHYSVIQRPRGLI